MLLDHSLVLVFQVHTLYLLSRYQEITSIANVIILFQESVGTDGGREKGTRVKDEENGGRDGTGVRDEGQGEEAKVEGLGGGDVQAARRQEEGIKGRS